MRVLDRLKAGVAGAWAGRGSPLARGILVALTPFEWPFRGVVGVRNAWFDRQGGTRPPLPVVSVGNLTVGGAGKTPILHALWEWLEEGGIPTALVTRGYGEDELALYRRWMGPDRVFVTPRRLEGVAAAAEAELKVALIDDGFQHRALQRHLDVLLIGAESPHPPRLLPRGPYREPLSSAKRADLVLVTHREGGPGGLEWRSRIEAAAPDVPVGEVGLGTREWTTLDDQPTPPPEGNLLAVASTADPGGFERLLTAQVDPRSVELLAYPDHHRYTERDASEILKKAAGRTVATTEKDAVKLVAFPALDPVCRVLRFGVVGGLPKELIEPLQNTLEEARTW